MCPTHETKRSTTPTGFTLLEVLVAVAITGTAIVLLLQAHTGSMRLYERSREMVIAQHMARELISEMEVSGYLGDIEDSGDAKEQYPGFTWRRTCRMVGPESPGVYEVTVIITGPCDEYGVLTRFMENE